MVDYFRNKKLYRSFRARSTRYHTQGDALGFVISALQAWFQNFRSRKFRSYELPIGQKSKNPGNIPGL